MRFLLDEIAIVRVGFQLFVAFADRFHGAAGDACPVQGMPFVVSHENTRGFDAMDLDSSRQDCRSRTLTVSGVVNANDPIEYER